MLGIILSFFVFQNNCSKTNQSIITAPSSKPDPIVYYLVAERTPVHGDSYIVPITNAADIATADNIINGTAPAQIVVANIDYGSGRGQYKNMDLLDPNKRVWSWHVTSFQNFADFTAEILDGYPTYVEENLDQWMQNTNGAVGFWSYTVIRRVATSEMN